MNKETYSIIVIHNILPMFCKHFCNFLPTKWFLTSQLLTKLLSPVSKCGTNLCLLWGSTVISHWQHDISNGMHTRSSVWITLTFSTSLFMFYLTKGINNSVDYCGVCADDDWLKQPHLARVWLDSWAGWCCTPVAHWVIPHQTKSGRDLLHGNMEHKRHESSSADRTINRLATPPPCVIVFGGAQ